MKPTTSDAWSPDFIASLENNDLGKLKLVPKGDLHNHALLGGTLAAYEEYCGLSLPEPPEFFDFREFDRYILEDMVRHLSGKPVARIIEHYLFLFAQTLRSARANGVTVLETSLDCSFLGIFGGNTERLVDSFRGIIDRESGGMEVRPELGMSRQFAPKDLDALAVPCMESGFFASIDLYSDEREGDLEDFVPFFRRAASLGLRKKAHAGELKGADFVRESVELLELDAVQHGIAAADSPEVMKWLARRGTVLNVCPTSNIRLKRAKDYRSHPLRALIDNGVRVTIGSDDAMVFDSEVSGEYLHLFGAGVFSPSELDSIRISGLS